MIDREQMYWEVKHEEQIWKPQNRRQPKEFIPAWIVELTTILGALAVSTGLWVGLDRLLHFFR